MREEVNQEFKASLNYKFIFKRNTHAHKRTGKDNFCHQITLIDNGEKNEQLCDNYSLYGANKVAQQVKVLADKPDHLNLISRKRKKPTLARHSLPSKFMLTKLKYNKN